MIFVGLNLFSDITKKILSRQSPVRDYNLTPNAITTRTLQR